MSEPRPHVLWAMYGFPDREMNGAPMASWAFVSALRERGFPVTVAGLIDERYAWDIGRAERLLRTRAIPLEVIRSAAPLRQDGWRARTRRLLCPTLEELFPSVSAGPALARVIDRTRPHCLVMYHLEPAAAALAAGPAIPRLAIVGDPAHLPAYYRWRGTPPALTREYADRAAVMMRDWLSKPSATRAMLSGCGFVGELAAHHAEELRRHGVPGCVHMRMPIADEAGPDWAAHRASAASKRAVKVILIGDLLATSSRSGLELFVDNVWPRVWAALGPGAIEAHVIGRGQPGGRLAGRLRQPGIVLRGPVAEAGPEMRSADVLLIPTPITLGVRTRAIVAFSYGCCVVAHQANAAGLPEMVHEQNALLAGDGAGLTEALLRAAKDQALRERLGRAGRATYERYFHPAVAVAPLAAEIERLATRQTLQPIEA